MLQQHTYCYHVFYEVTEYIQYFATKASTDICMILMVTGVTISTMQMGVPSKV